MSVAPIYESIRVNITRSPCVALVAFTMILVRTGTINASGAEAFIRNNVSTKTTPLSCLALVACILGLAIADFVADTVSMTGAGDSGYRFG
jgi:uncharacterized membrane protein YwzB